MLQRLYPRYSRILSWAFVCPALLFLSAVGTLTPAHAHASGVQERAGGLLSVEQVGGEARDMRRPNPLLLARPDGSVTALIYYTFAGNREGEAVLADLTSGTVEVQKIPGNLGNVWSRQWGPDGRLYMGLWGPATLIRYDPVTHRLDTFGVIEPASRSVPLLTVGTDDLVYAMCSNNGRVFSIDPATDAIVHHGQQGPDRTHGIAYNGSFAVDDQYIYSTFGNIERETFTLATHKASGEQTLLDAIRGARIRQLPNGATATHDGQTYWLYQGRAILQEGEEPTAPWPAVERPERKAPPTMPGRPEMLGNSILTEPDGTVTLWYRLDRDQPWQSLVYQVALPDLFYRTIGTLPDGRIFASVTYNGLYSYDPATGQSVHEGIAPLSNYSLQVVGDKVWLASYPGGNSLFVWDASKPWTVNRSTPEAIAPRMTDPQSNPRQYQPGITRVGPNGFQHPYFATVAGNRFYVGVHGERHNAGGLLAWTEMDSDERGFLREGLENYDVDGLCAAMGGQQIVFSSRAVRGIDGSPAPASGRLFVVSTDNHQVLWTLDPLPGVRGTGMVIEGAPGEVIGIAPVDGAWLAAHMPEADIDGDGTVIYRVDLARREVTQKTAVPGMLAGRRGYFHLSNLVRGPDGLLYTLHDDFLASVDPVTFDVTRISRIGKPGRLTFHGEDVYLSGEARLRRVPGVLAR